MGNESSVNSWEVSPRVRLAIWWHRWQRQAKEVAALFLPDACQLCEGPIAARRGGGLCHRCIKDMPRIDHACRRCGSPVPLVVGPVDQCPHCRKGRWPARRTMAWGVYGGPLQKAVVLMKQPGSEPLALTLGRCMGDWLARFPDRLPYDWILPTPKHWIRRIAHPHNSPELIAESIGSRLAVPVDPHQLVRVRSTAKQGTLLRHERAKNVQGAFRVSRPHRIRNRRILVVDDILTSGATAAEMVMVLKGAGATVVDVACLARGIGK